MNFGKNNLRLLMELVVVVGLVLLFFSIFLGTLNVMFPTGTSFSELMGKGGGLSPASSRGRTGRDANVLEQPIVLSKSTNMAKNKRSDDIVWTFAHVGLNIYDRDAVQTFKDASVQLTIDEGENYLEMGENSLIIISRNEKDVEKNEKRSLFVMVDGQLRGKLSQHGKERRTMEISTSSAVLRVPAGGKDLSGAEFKVSINKDRSSTFTVLNGTAEVVAQGQSVLLNENQTLTVGLNEPPPVPQELPREVTLTGPMNEQILYYRDIPPRVKFSWLPLSNEREYRILVAKDRDFSTLVVDEWVTEHFFVHGNLKKGDYFWKVGLRRKSTCETRQVHMVRITKAPTIQLETIPHVVRSDRYVIKGTTDPYVRVIIEGKDVETDGAGRFEYTLRLQRGANRIVIEAVDKAGNIAYGVVRIFAKN